jgi:pimeloyl-ACP methyl ester carboxylesterase
VAQNFKLVGQSQGSSPQDLLHSGKRIDAHLTKKVQHVERDPVLTDQALMVPLVLIPGMMCDARMWGGIPAALYPRRVTHFLPTGADSMADLARNFLRDAPQHFALAGLSMGGILAMEVLAQAPDRVERLALLDTRGASPSRTPDCAGLTRRFGRSDARRDEAELSGQTGGSESGA